MALKKNGTFAALFLAFIFVACGDDSDKTFGGSVDNQDDVMFLDKTISGVSQKGPFVNGSSVSVQELDSKTLAQTGLGFEGKIKNDLGEFSVNVKRLDSPYALLKANGFYRNEVTGEKSKSQVTLYALTDLSNRSEVNINLLTHLEYERSLYLATVDSMTVIAAKKQAEREIFSSFGIDGDFKNAEDLSIFGVDEGSAALLAISILMQGDLSEADFSERLANYAADIETDGKWNDAEMAAEIADWGEKKSLDQSLIDVRAKITSWGLSYGVPAFEKYVDIFWWQNYGLGICSESRNGEVRKNENSLSDSYGAYFICENRAWRVADDIEYDTYQQKCDEDGKIVFGNVNKNLAYDCDEKIWRHASDVEAALGGCIEEKSDEMAKTDGAYYICQNREWRAATDIEMDTYKWQNTMKEAKDGDVKYGDVVKTNCYVYENASWRSGNATDCSLGLRGCTAMRQDTVGKGNSDAWYKCVSLTWRTATDIEKDSATWGAGKFDGEVRAGQINKIFYYIYDASIKAWRKATTLEKDTYDYKNNKDWTDGMEGEIKKGEVTDTIYVFDSTVWRIATEIEYDTYGQECSKFGKIIYGNVNKDYAYFCYDDKWKRFYGNEKILYGKLVDERDGHIYRTVKIGEQTWMAENLNYDSGQWSFCDEEDSCAIYGRYYRYDVNHRSEAYVGICPSGWHVPSSEEWNSFSSAVGKKSKALQAQGFIGWTDADDEFGFSALPVGNLFMNMGKAEIFNFGGDNAYFVGSTGDNACGWLNNFIIGKNESELTCGAGGSLFGYSVRCIQD